MIFSDLAMVRDIGYMPNVAVGSVKPGFVGNGQACLILPNGKLRLCLV